MALEGKLIGVKINGTYVRCQTAASLTITQDVTDDDPCKPTEAETTNGANWVTNTEGPKSWSISATAKAFADVQAGFIDNSDILLLMVEGSSGVEVTFQTIKTTDYAHASLLLFEGTGTLTNFNMTGDADGNATYDIEVTGNGAPTFVKTPVTP